MTPATLLISFFLFTLCMVGVAGYALVLRPSRSETAAVGLPAPIVVEPAGAEGSGTLVLDIFRILGDALPDAVAKRAQARRMLQMAGFRWPSSVAVFLGIKCATSFTLGVAAVWAALTFGDGANLFLPGLCGMGFGFLVPDRVLERLARKRADRIRRGLPAALDLMVLSVEAGQGMDAALLDTSRGLRSTHPDLASEFMQLHLELRADASRSDALKAFAARSQDSELKKFSALLRDTDRFGSSLGPALKSHAHYLRTRFRQAAQERARKVAVKLIFPVFFLIFPSVILVTLGPAAILIYTQMQNLLGL